MRLPIIACWVVASSYLWQTPHSCAQAPPAVPASFVVAAIKPSDPNRPEDDQTIGFSPGGFFVAKSQSLKELIEFAYSLDLYDADVDKRILGGPKWLGSAKFDIKAKSDEQIARALGKMSVKQQIRSEQTMIQALLADRFRLKIHMEKRELAAYALVLSNGGSKMKQSARDDPEEPNDADGPPGNWVGNGVTMQSLADDLSPLPEIGRIVVDKTGLKGAYDFTLRWTTDLAADTALYSYDDNATTDLSAPTLLTALQEQVGLKLILSKEPVDVIVIDSAASPSEN